MENHAGTPGPPVKSPAALGGDPGDGPHVLAVLATGPPPLTPADRMTLTPQGDQASRRRSSLLATLAIFAVMLGLALLSLAVSLRL
jgi:hypothetical protein